MVDLTDGEWIGGAGGAVGGGGGAPVYGASVRVYRF